MIMMMIMIHSHLKIQCLVLRMTLNLSVVVQSMTGNCGHTCAFGRVDEAVSGYLVLATQV